MLAVQKDVYSAFSRILATYAVAAWDSNQAHDPRLKDAVDLLRNWNGQMEKGTSAPMIADLLYQQLRSAAAERAAPGLGPAYAYEMSTSAVERLLRERPADWFPDYNELLLKCLANAIEEGAKIGGSKVSRWDYGYYKQLTIAHPVASQLPLIGKYFNIGPVPMSGSPTTVKQNVRRLGPSMRMVVDLADLDHSLQNITIGESGQILSSHYRDQWSAYYGGTSFPMQFRKVDARQVLTVSPK
jgi:penicillin amidase